jgi:predicted dehydrogenase
MAGKVRWGILATGWIADLFVKDLQMHGHAVTAVGSRSQAGADEFAKRFGIARAHGSYEALCADPEVDAIYVATPHPMHHANARLALEHGKHVLIEKAFTVNAREAQELVDLAASKGLVVLEAMWTRFLPHMVRIREILASGALGEIRSVVADHTQDLPDDPKHRLNALELGGGALLDLGVYPISFVFDLLGKPDGIVAKARKKDTGADGTIATMFTYANGAIALTISASDTAGRNIATVHGTDGRIEIDTVWYQPTSFRHYRGKEELVEEYRSDVKGRGMQYQAAELERLVAAGDIAGTILSPAESVAIMACMDEIRAQIGLRYPTE